MCFPLRVRLPKFRRRNCILYSNGTLLFKNHSKIKTSNHEIWTSSGGQRVGWLHVAAGLHSNIIVAQRADGCSQ